MKSHRIAILPGDGVGVEVAAVARDVLDAVGEKFGREFVFTEHLIGGAAIDAMGDPLPPETLNACRESDAVLLGAVGGPKWDGGKRRPEEGLLGIRKALGLYANIRPLFMHEPLVEHSPLKAEIAEGVNLVVFRELTGGSYYGEKKQTATEASDACVYTAPEIERIARAAFKAARTRRGKVTSVDKANVMATSRLWRQVVTRVRSEEFPDVELEHVLIDAMTMHVLKHPRSFDVIVTENMFGDILTDELAALAGSLGLAPSASLGESGPCLFEPVHGSAPDIAGRDVANPIGAVLCAALLLHYGLGLQKEADALEAAVSDALAGGARTRDLGGRLGCRAMGERIIGALDGVKPHHALAMHWG